MAIVVKDANYSTLEAALAKAGLVGALSANGPFTAFAPTNAAFQAAGITDLNDYTAEELTPILLYHVLNGSAAASSLQDQVVTALNDKEFFLGENDDVYIS